MKQLKYKPSDLICVAHDLFGNDVFMKRRNSVKVYKNSGRVYVFMNGYYYSCPFTKFFNLHYE